MKVNKSIFLRILLSGALLSVSAEAADVQEWEKCLQEIRIEFPGLDSVFLKDFVQKAFSVFPEKFIWIKKEQGEECVRFIPGSLKGQIEILGPAKFTECGHRWVETSAEGKVQKQGEFAFHPLSHFSESDLIPEIIKLHRDATVPAEVYKKYDSRRIAITLIYRKHFYEEVDSGSKPFTPSYDYLDDSRPQMMVKHEFLKAIAEKGFLNQHQFKPAPSPGVYAPFARANSEDRLIGVTLAVKNDLGDSADAEVNAVLNQVRPKYSFLDLTAAGSNEHPLASSPQAGINEYRYGDVVAVFNPDVNDRATFTMGDSLTGADKARSLRVKLGNDLSAEATSFVEAQIWGELKLSDVNHFLVNCPTPFDPLNTEEIEKIKSFGKPVFACEPINAQRPAAVRPWNKTIDGPSEWDQHWKEKVVRYGKGREL